MSSIEALLQWVDTHPGMSLITLAVIFLSIAISTTCLYLSALSLTAGLERCIMFWIKCKYQQDQAHPPSRPKDSDFEPISKIAEGLQEIVALLKVQTDETTEAISPKAAPRKRRTRRGKKKKAKLSQDDETAGDLSDVVMRRKHQKQQAKHIQDSSDSEEDESEEIILIEESNSENDGVASGEDAEETTTAAKNKPQSPPQAQMKKTKASTTLPGRGPPQPLQSRKSARTAFLKAALEQKQKG